MDTDLMRLWCAGFAMTVLCAIPVAALAESLPDPTRPPAEIIVSPTPGGLAAAPAAAPENTGLQSVIISPVRRAAIIGGKMVEQGAKYGDATLIEVSESGIVLQGSQGKLRELVLFPGVGMKKKTDAPETGVDNSSVKPSVAGASGVSSARKKKAVKKTAHRVVAPEKKEDQGK